MNDMWTMTLVSTSRDPEGNAEKTELISDAGYTYSSRGKKAIIYDEPAEQDMGDDSTMKILVLSASSISLQRRGSFQMHLQLQTGRWNYCQYCTPYGDLTVGVMAKYIHDTLTPEGGRLHFRYIISGTGGMVSDVEIDLNIEKAKQ